jgi:hypothetical protein
MSFTPRHRLLALRVIGIALTACCLSGCSTVSRAPNADPATVARRQAAWTGIHQVNYAYLQHGGENDVSMSLILSPALPPFFQSWSEAETRVTSSSSVRRVAAIPGEVAEYRSSDLSGGAESLQRASRNTLVKASFDPGYTTLTLLYLNSAFHGLLQRSFRLDESAEPPVVVGDEGSVYTKLP